MDEKEVLIESIKAIKEHLKEQEDIGIRLGLSIALNVIKGRVLDDDLLEKIGLNENFEKYV